MADNVNIEHGYRELVLIGAVQALFITMAYCFYLFMMFDDLKQLSH